MNRVFVLGESALASCLSWLNWPSTSGNSFDWIAKSTKNVNFDLEKLLTWIDLSPWPRLQAPVRQRLSEWGFHPAIRELPEQTLPRSWSVWHQDSIQGW